MTLEQLRIFVAVANREHVTLGAQDLHLTQSAVSAAIAALEARHAVKLFDRVGRRIVLTDAGRLFLGEAKAVLARAAAAETMLSDLGDLKRGTLALAASQTIANYWLPQVIHAFAQRFPGIKIRLDIGNTTTVASDVKAGSVDIGLVEGDIDEPDLIIEHVSDDDLVLVVPPEHAWVTAMPEPADAFRAADWVLREEGSGTRSIFEAMLPAFGLAAFDLHVALDLPSNEAVRTAVEAGAGVTVLSRLVVAQSLQAGTLAIIPLALPPRRFYALRHRERYQSRAASEFRQLISAMAHSKIGGG
jgi:DNA-binding transcriptional LysR family regulator